MRTYQSVLGWALLAYATLPCAEAAPSAASAPHSPDILFSSTYTNLAKDCKAAGNAGEDQDDALRCKGYGGYELYLYFSAAGVHLVLRKADGASLEGLDPIELAGYEKGMIEWRHAGGQPFALIARTGKVVTAQDGTLVRQPTGKLAVQGLPGFAFIQGSTTTNVQAQALADQAYQRQRQAR